MKKIIAIENTIDRDGWPITLEFTAWKDDEGNIYDRTVDRDGWPIEILRTDWKEKA